MSSELRKGPEVVDVTLIAEHVGIVAIVQQWPFISEIYGYRTIGRTGGLRMGGAA